MFEEIEKCSECYFYAKGLIDNKETEFCTFGEYKELKPNQEKCVFFFSLKDIKLELRECL